MWSTGPSGKASGEPRGLTLLELCIVLLIVGLFYALLTVRVEGVVSGGDLAFASRMIIGEIQRVRGRAAHTRAQQVLVFDFKENGFFALEGLKKETGGLPEEEKEKKDPKVKHLPEGVFIEDVLYPAKGKVQEGEAGIVFFANGCVERALIHLRNERDRVYTLEISPLTGHVLIHDRYIEQKQK